MRYVHRASMLVVGAAGLAAAVWAVPVTQLLAQQTPPPEVPPPTAPPGERPSRPGPVDRPPGAMDRASELGRKLTGALEEVEGCLGTESARTPSGKAVIFAWFEDKEAVLRWYHSKTHVEVMTEFFPDARPDKHALAEVPSDAGPILVVASMRPRGGAPGAERGEGLIEFGIEVYEALPAGAVYKGGFAPEGVTLPGQERISGEAAENEAKPERGTR